MAAFLMHRKSKQNIERALRDAGAATIDWDEGQKHHIATVRLGSGHLFEMGWARSRTDEATARFIVKRKIKEILATTMPIMK